MISNTVSARDGESIPAQDTASERIQDDVREAALEVAFKMQDAIDGCRCSSCISDAAAIIAETILTERERYAAGIATALQNIEMVIAAAGTDKADSYDRSLIDYLDDAWVALQNLQSQVASPASPPIPQERQ